MAKSLTPSRAEPRPSGAHQLWSPSLVKLSHALPFSQHIIPPQGDVCISQDSPNEHAQKYPNLASGNLNGTTLIVPIPLTTARQLIPSEYGIVEKAYKALLPSFPDGMYPMMAQIVHDHDIQLPAYNASLSDFTRASLEFPFLDIFGNGYSSFRWVGTSMISASNPLAIEASQGYGMAIHPAVFDPLCDAYSALPSGATYARSWSANGTRGAFMAIEALPSPRTVPYPLDFFRNITNQPVFSNTQVCDHYLRLFNTSLTTGATAPVPVVGKVSTNLEPLARSHSWDAVYGWRLATPFLEPPTPSDCYP
ncbi:hypothetical protein F4677DRAFT_457892 [Hypoxylon crocopeplum]|nr:hypothetical protein F4677DRAFT_457892 [Hypoxylon crocopeplum]